jgi:dCMP deaminase
MKDNEWPPEFFGSVIRKRPTWDRTWIEVAKVMACRSKCVLAQVGAVIVTHDNRINSTCYNGPPMGMDAEGSCTNWCPRAMKPVQDRAPDYTDCISIHAEANALLRADWTEIHGGTIYSTSSCCMSCAKLIANSGLIKVIHIVRDDADLRRNPEGIEQFLQDAGLDAVRLSGKW